jgi:F-type H+-transporting ATPase subunit a
MSASPLTAPVLFSVGPVAVATPVVITWGIMVLLAGGSWLLTRRLKQRPGTMQTVLEFVVDAVEGQVRDTMHTAPARYVPLIGTLLLFILTSNWSWLIPGIEPPTAYLETDAGLALIVFCAMIWEGIRVQGLRGWLAAFAEPTIVMLPLNVLETFTRTFSMLVRLFGNVMSGVFVVGIILSLAGLLMPIPLMALDLLTGAVQAYIFSVLAMVFIGGAIGEERPPEAKGAQ